MSVTVTMKKTPADETAGSLEVSERVYGAPFNESLVHQVVTAYQAAMRSGTKAQKSRAQVRGGVTKKPWRQKGTGRARAGSTTGPIWVGGGRAFAAQPRDHSQKVPRKMYRGAIRSLLSELVRKGVVTVVESMEPESHRTKDFIAQMGGSVGKNTLLITHELTEKLYFSCRNLHQVFLTDVVGVDPLTLAAAHRVVVTKEAVQQIEEWLA